MRYLSLCWLVVANVCAAWLAAPEFTLPRGSQSHPMIATEYAFIIALLAAAGLQRWWCAVRNAQSGWRAVAWVGILLCLLPMPVYLALSHWAEQSRGLTVER